MKMIYQTKRTKTSFWNGRFFRISVSILIVLLIVFGASDFARNLVSGIFFPFFKTGNIIYDNLNRVPRFFYDKEKLIKENEMLTEQIKNANLDAISYESVKYENQRLREELKIKPVGDFVAVSVVAKPPQIPQDSLLLDIGSEDGINIGDYVLAGDRVIVGRVAEIFKNKSTVRLNSFAGTVSYGYVARTDEALEIEGNGGGNMESKVPIDFDIAVGDKIMIGGTFIHLAAVVGAVEEDELSGFKNVLMSLPFSMSKINMVFIYPTVNE